MLVNIKDEDFAKQLIADRDAEPVDLFLEFYKNEVEERINNVCETLEAHQLLKEDKARAYLMDKIPYSDYDYVFDYLRSQVDEYVENLAVIEFDGDVRFVMRIIGGEEQVKEMISGLSSEAFPLVTYSTPLEEVEFDYRGELCFADISGSCEAPLNQSFEGLDKFTEELGLKVEVIAHDLYHQSAQRLILDRGEVLRTQNMKFIDKPLSEVGVSDYEAEVVKLNQFII